MATSTTKGNTLEAKQVKTLLDGIFNVLNEIGRPNAKPDQAKLSKYFAPDFQLTANENKSAAQNLNQLQERMQKIKAEYPTIEFSKFEEPPLVDQNRIAIHYTMNVTDKNNKKQALLVAAFLTIEEDKVSKWHEIVHEKDAGICLNSCSSSKK
ncbi:MAG: hypothetical protein Q8K75_01440 [Chlamydiales bacterium]|nr:hypothetical protein [Chlamydiales bacterium]